MYMIFVFEFHSLTPTYWCSTDRSTISFWWTNIVNIEVYCKYTQFFIMFCVNVASSRKSPIIGWDHHLGIVRHAVWVLRLNESFCGIAFFHCANRLNTVTAAVFSPLRQTVNPCCTRNIVNCRFILRYIF